MRIARTVSSEGTDLLVGGEDLDALIATKASVVDLRIPVEAGRVADWAAFEDIVKYVVVKELGIRRAHNDTPALLVVPLAWSTVDMERAVQIMFETINVPGLLVADAPLVSLFACGIVTGLVIDMGHETTDIAAVIDSSVCKHSAQTLPIGGKHVHAYLHQLLEHDPLFMQSLSVGGFVLDDELVQAFIANSGQCKLLNVKEWTRPPLINQIKRTEWVYKGVKLSIGAQRHQAFEVFFQPSLAGIDSLGIPEASYLTVMGCSDQLDKRFSVWEGVFLTGGASAVPGLQERYEKEMDVFMSASATSNDFQAKEIKFAGIPEFFGAYKQGGCDAAYLGGVIVARLTLGSPSQHITRNDYNEHGPGVVRIKG
ncbi:actin family [Chytriomyces sp. MP71]|nr:actin family [Chytriomyces sp. MP71]